MKDPNPGTHVWIELEVSKGGGLISTYRGRIERRVLEQWRSGELSRGAVVLEDVYWWVADPENEDGGSYVVMGQTTGTYGNCTGRVYLRVDAVLVIIELQNGAERDLALTQSLGPRNEYPA